MRPGWKNRKDRDQGSRKRGTGRGVTGENCLEEPEGQGTRGVVNVEQGREARIKKTDGTSSRKMVNRKCIAHTQKR